MQKAFEKIVERLEEEYNRNDKQKKEAYEEQDWERFDLFTHRNEGIYSAMSIVNQVAEEYKNKFTDKSPNKPDNPPTEHEEVCEWIIDKDPLGTRYTTCIGNDFIQDDPFDWDYCPYCGKKIKVVE